MTGPTGALTDIIISFFLDIFDANDIMTLASLPSLDELRGKIVGILQAPAVKVAQVLQAPGGQVARVISAYSEKGKGVA